MVRVEPGLQIKELEASDAGAFGRLLLSLDQPSRCSRFGMMVSDSGLIAHAGRAHETTLWLGGAFVKRGLRGVAELYATEDPTRGEIAFVVEGAWRRRGLATALLEAALTWATAGRMERIRMVCSRHDWPMRHLANSMGSRLDLMLGDLVAETTVTKRRMWPGPRFRPAMTDVAEFNLERR